ncbi:Zinc finger CCCH-type [Penicillium cf. griseofulvum]|nr:Zinc finger CCCH-type [Penicillium cf. griseofulvum]
MVVCTFFQQGRCKFGDRCKFEHPGKPTTGPSGNRFGAISGGFGVSLRQVKARLNNRPSSPAVKASDIKSDLTAGQGRPEWIFSAYAPHKDVARQLFGGAHRERSMEEMRLRHYELAAAGNLNQAVQEASALWQECVQQMEISLSDLNGAVKYTRHHRGKTPTSMSQAPAPFGQPSTFGQPSPFGQQNVAPTPNTGPAPGAFGAPSSTFGQASGLGQSGGFGRASAPAQPAGMGQSTAFGQTSALGGSAFGQTSTLGGQSAFNKSPFGQPALTQPGVNPSPFGAPSVVSPFTQVAQNQPAAGGFGQIAGQIAGQPAPSPFGQAAVNPSPFGQPSAPAGAAPFGQPSAPAGAAPFGQPSAPAAAAPFGQPSAPAGAAPFGAPSAASPFTQVSQSQPATVQGVPVQNVNAGPRAYIKIDNPQDLNPLPQLDGETRHNPSTKQLVIISMSTRATFTHKTTKPLSESTSPNGPPDPASLKDAHGKPEEYTPEVAEAYQFFLQNGYFKDGNIPAVPPKQEWLSFDF